MWIILGIIGSQKSFESYLVFKLNQYKKCLNWQTMNKKVIYGKEKSKQRQQ